MGGVDGGNQLEVVAGSDGGTHGRPHPATGTEHTHTHRADASVARVTAQLGSEPQQEWSTPSARLRTLRRYEVGALTILAVVVGVVVCLLVGAGYLAIVVGAAVVVGGAITDTIAGRRVRAWGFTERAEDLLVRRGVMFRRLSVVPYGRMQYIEVTAGPLERSMGLATVQMHTAAAASDARIPGLPAAEAARLRDQLTALGEGQTAGL